MSRLLAPIPGHPDPVVIAHSLLLRSPANSPLPIFLLPPTPRFSLDHRSRAALHIPYPTSNILRHSDAEFIWFHSDGIWWNANSTECVTSKCVIINLCIPISLSFPSSCWQPVICIHLLMCMQPLLFHYPACEKVRKVPFSFFRDRRPTTSLESFRSEMG